MRLFSIMILAVSISIAACGGTTARRTASADTTTAGCTPTTDRQLTEDGNPEAQGSELPLPDVPSTLREPAERARFIIEHFWDAMDFTDSSRALNDDFMELNFANFVSVFPYAAEDARRSAVDRLMTAAAIDSAAYCKLADVAEKYLYEPNSPMLSEEYYILFLEKLTQSPVLGQYGTIRYRYQLEAALKNRPGTIASDFAYVTRDGRRMRLSTTPVGEGASLLLIFYDPECEHCKDIMNALSGDAVLAAAAAEGRLTILAMYADGNRPLWERTVHTLPEEWTAGFVTDDIHENQTYVLRAMPTLFLLDADKRIVMKDAPAAAISEIFRHR